MAVQRAYEIDPNSTTLPWLESPFTQHLLANATHLGASERALAAQYARDGYVIVDLNVDAPFCETIIGGLEPYYRPNSGAPYSDTHRIQDAWRLPIDAGRAARDLATNAKIIDTLRVLYRREPIPFQTLNFPHGTQQSTHSDTIHFHSAPERYMCGVWVALEDVHIDAGPLHYYPRSHKLPIYTLADLGIRGSGRIGADGKPEIYGDAYIEYERFIASMVRSHGLERRTLCIKRGQALIWSANLLHGGNPIIDQKRSRHSQVSHYYFENCVYYTPMSSDLPIGAMATRSIINLCNDEQIQGAYQGAPVKLVEPGRPPVIRLASAARYPLATQAEKRILCWPLYDSQEQLERLARLCAKPLVGRDDACLCLRYDPAYDPPMQQVLANLKDTLAGVLGEDASISVLVVDNQVPRQEWASLGAQATCFIKMGGESGEKADFLHAMPVPIVPAEALASRL